MCSDQQGIKLPDPKPDWQRFACLQCGNVRELPSDGDRPWCTHHDGNSWNAPTQYAIEHWRKVMPRNEWTQMIPVKVEVVPLD